MTSCVIFFFGHIPFHSFSFFFLQMMHSGVISSLRGGSLWRNLELCFSLIQSECSAAMFVVLQCLQLQNSTELDPLLCVSADQVYGDQDMHEVVRKHCMDYLVSGSAPPTPPPPRSSSFCLTLLIKLFLFLTDEERRLFLQLCDRRLHHIHQQEEEKQLPRQPH